MSDIFISYASPDRLRAKPLADALRQRGWSVWWDRTILAGKNWDQAIEAALADAKCVIVLWSRDSVQSDWVRTEAEEAKRRGILVPALLDNVNIPLAFRRLQAANLVGWTGTQPSAEFDDLANAISEVLRHPSRAVAESSARSAGVEPSIATARDAAASTVRRAPAARSNRTFVALAIGALACIIGILLYVAGPERQVRQGPAPQEPARKPKENIASGTPSNAISSASTFAPGQVRKNPADGLEYVWIPPGEFTMGCSAGDRECDRDENPPHAVTITRGFWLGKTEVTAAAHGRFHAGSLETAGTTGEDATLPAVMVDWDDANAYCAWAGMRLPTEAEWEYAARAESSSARYGALDEIAWYLDNSDARIHPVAGKAPNRWGLYDMLGNAFEWVGDWYAPGYYHQKTSIDPAGPARGQLRVLRGGSWSGGAQSIRASFRLGLGPKVKLNSFGFRCAGALL